MAKTTSHLNTSDTLESTETKPNNITLDWINQFLNENTGSILQATFLVTETYLYSRKLCA